MISYRLVSVSAPAEYVVARHLLGHPDEPPNQVASHCRLHRPVVYQAVRRLRERDLLAAPRLLHHLQHHPRAIRHRSHYFRAPNPQQWFRAYPGHALVSGDIVAAERDGYNVVPNQWIAYVEPKEEKAAVQAALDVFADHAPREKANLVIRLADPWLRADDEDPRIVERGQRLLDYAESPLLQLVGRPR